jgi:hypothetical protein
MPPSVCCANRGELHSAKAAVRTSSRGSRDGKMRIEDFKWPTSKVKNFPIGFLTGQRTLN